MDNYPKIGDLVRIPNNRPGPKIGRLKNILEPDSPFPHLSRCVVERDGSYVFGIRLGELVRIEKGA